MSPGKHNDDRDILLRNVEICLTPEKKIFIHSSFLISCSGYFATSFDKAWVERSGLSHELEDAPIVYRLSLEDDPTGDFLILHVCHVMYAIASADIIYSISPIRITLQNMLQTPNTPGMKPIIELSKICSTFFNIVNQS
jgi:hypothetical protein